jgi:hypothetical protein
MWTSNYYGLIFIGAVWWEVGNHGLGSGGGSGE